MRVKRKFSLEFKQQVVGELLSEVYTSAQICRRYELSPGLLYHWKRQYERGKLDNEPTEKGRLEEQVRELQRLLGQKTFENEFLKKALQKLAAQRQRGESSLPAVGEERGKKDVN
jgi:transposase